jgi:hypothetical protein
MRQNGNNNIKVNQNLYAYKIYFYELQLGSHPVAVVSRHLHTNGTQNDTKQTIHRTTQKLGYIYITQDRKCTCHVTLRHVRATIVEVEKH